MKCTVNLFTNKIDDAVKTESMCRAYLQGRIRGDLMWSSMNLLRVDAGTYYILSIKDISKYGYELVVNKIGPNLSKTGKPILNLLRKEQGVLYSNNYRDVKACYPAKPSIQRVL